MNPEKIIEKQCVEYLEKSGWFTFKITQPISVSRGKNIPGIPDRYAIKQGISVWIEFKAKTAQREAQKRFQDNLEANGGIYLLIHSMDELINKLKQYDNTKKE